MANLAIIYNQGGNPWEAIEWYEKALTIINTKKYLEVEDIYYKKDKNTWL